MLTASLNVTANVAGVAVSAPIARSTSAGLPVDLSGTNPLATAKAGTLSTRTNNTDGTLTLAVGHGITTAQVVDLYWTGGRRYGVVVGTVSGQSVPISGGAGDNLPTQGAAVTCQVQTTVDVDFLGDLLKLLIIHCDKRGRVGFYNGASLVLGVDLVANEPYLWIGDQNIANPLAGATVTQLKVTQSSDAGTAALRVGIMYNA